ncbi:MAG: hypothetical protein K0R49_699 [Burkholderiales bacterium]|jgi:hypothetical protein|nr:hypothetical protein [Burkholderiales bacterium]MCE3268447.1 hypothetical protein [Burkholderiales bacterium]
MRKLIFILVAVVASYYAVAEHNFTVCYINQSADSVPYINNGISYKWKDRGELVGKGNVAPGQTKCFEKIKDETVFLSHMITFYVNNKWFGIINSGFAHPYVIAQYATEKKGGKLHDATEDGRDNYELHIFIMKDGSFQLKTGKDDTNSLDIIKPRKYNKL